MTDDAFWQTILTYFKRSAGETSLRDPIISVVVYRKYSGTQFVCIPKIFRDLIRVLPVIWAITWDLTRIRRFSGVTN